MTRLLIAALFVPALAQAQYLNFKMVASQQNPFPYYVDARAAAPGGVQQSAMKTAVDSAWSTWNAVSCAVPKVLGKGFTTGAVPNPPDHTDAYNVTPVWSTSRSDQAYVDVIGSQFVVAITVPTAYAGVLQTCDTYFNGADYAWSVQGTTAQNDMDVQTVMLHEAGHCLGLDHLGNAGDAMQVPVTPGTTQRTLGAGDLTALCQRYPLTGAVGAPCFADGGCGGASNVKCVTEAMGGGVTLKFCSQGCTVNTGSACEFPLYCQDSTFFTPSNGACLYPTTAVTQVGKACATAGACGNANSECLLPEPLPSGNDAWAGGYCSQTCELGQAPCPPGSLCTLFTDNTHHCLATCRPGLADCRSQYACVATASGGSCQTRCYTSADCGDPVNYECRTCDGLCVSKQNPTGQIGDVCSADTTCGAGQVCLSIDRRLPLKQCTQQCSRGCGVCPAGSTCHPLERGDLYCLRDCSGPGTCPQGERCGDFATGKACMPACRTNVDCPVGQECNSGECAIPQNLEDGGACGTLCQTTDAGKPIVVSPKDAGLGAGPSTAGCGCGSTPSALAWVLLALGAALAGRRGASWHR